MGPGDRGKIFAFLGPGVGIKAARTREAADGWLQRYLGSASVMALDGEIPDDEVVVAVDESYRLVVEGLPTKVRPDGWDAL